MDSDEKVTVVTEIAGAESIDIIDFNPMTVDAKTEAKNEDEEN